jgi:uncharacterized protein YecT (DUF1311 family)
MVGLMSLLLLAASAQPEAIQPDPSPCDNPAPEDARPYTLCLAETWFNEAEATLNTQWQITLAHTRTHGGAGAERRLRKEQRQWLHDRDRECAAFARSTPVTQTSRNELSCSAQIDERRTTYLRRLVQRK